LAERHVELAFSFIVVRVTRLLHFSQSLPVLKADLPFSSTRYQQPYQRYVGAQIDVKDKAYDRDFNTVQGPPADYAPSQIDVTERQIRQRTRPIVGGYAEKGYTSQTSEPSFGQPAQFVQDRIQTTRDTQPSYGQPAEFVQERYTSRTAQSAQPRSGQQDVEFVQTSRTAQPAQSRHGQQDVEFVQTSRTVQPAQSRYDQQDVEFVQTSRTAPQPSQARFSQRDVEFVDSRSQAPAREEIRVEKTTRRTVDPPKKHKLDMGYYDEDGHYHSFRHGLHKVADRIIHPIHGSRHHHHQPEEREEVIIKEHYSPAVPPTAAVAPRVSSSVTSVSSYSEPRTMAPNTITIPCHHIRIGDLLILQGRPCQVIRITTSSQTGQHRYLGVDLFTKQLHEESSFISNPAPSVIVQNMLGPVFKQYRVLDIREDSTVVAMTETGDVKQGLPVLDQSGLLSRLAESFDNGRGSVRVLVINDDGQEMAVDYKVIHGSRL
jgi:Eukaryotic elongation factor 5A hypusine, DNA-binding OB fold